MLDTRIKFDERYDCEENQTTTLYFIAPKEMLKTLIPNQDYPEAVSMEISIEFPTEHIEPEYASVCISPTKQVDDSTEDYDWNDIEIPYNEVQELIKLAGL